MQKRFVNDLLSSNFCNGHPEIMSNISRPWIDETQMLLPIYFKHSGTALKLILKNFLLFSGNTNVSNPWFSKPLFCIVYAIMVWLSYLISSSIILLKLFCMLESYWLGSHSAMGYPSLEEELYPTIWTPPVSTAKLRRPSYRSSSTPVYTWLKTQTWIMLNVSSYPL